MLALFPFCRVITIRKNDTSVLVSVHLLVYFFESEMINVESVTTMLADRLAKKDSYRPSGNIREQQLVDQLYKILDNVRTSSSYEMKNENTLDYDALFDDAHEDENYDTEADEENDPTFYGTEGEEEL
jgi:hypothetical protein